MALVCCSEQIAFVSLFYVCNESLVCFLRGSNSFALQGYYVVWFPFLARNSSSWQQRRARPDVCTSFPCPNGVLRLGNGLDVRGRSLVRFSQRAGISKTFRPFLWPAQLPGQCVSGNLSWGSAGRYVKLTAYFRLVRRLRTNGAVSPLPAYALMTSRGRTIVMCTLTKESENVRN